MPPLTDAESSTQVESSDQDSESERSPREPKGLRTGYGHGLITDSPMSARGNLVWFPSGVAASSVQDARDSPVIKEYTVTGATRKQKRKEDSRKRK